VRLGQLGPEPDRRGSAQLETWGSQVLGQLGRLEQRLGQSRRGQRVLGQLVPRQGRCRQVRQVLEQAGLGTLVPQELGQGRSIQGQRAAQETWGSLGQLVRCMLGPGPDRRGSGRLGYPAQESRLGELGLGRPESGCSG